MTRRRTLPCLSLANPIRKTKEGNPNLGASGVKPEVANLYTFAANTQTGPIRAGDERQGLNVNDGLAAALARLEAILNRSRAAIVPVLHPGIGQPEVLATLRGIGLSPSAEAVTRVHRRLERVPGRARGQDPDTARDLSGRRGGGRRETRNRRPGDGPVPGRGSPPGALDTRTRPRRRQRGHMRRPRPDDS